MECQRGQNCQTTKSHCQMVTAFSNQHILRQTSILKAEIHSQMVTLFTNQKSIINLNKKIHYQTVNPFSKQKSIIKTEICSQKQKSINPLSNGQSIVKTGIHYQTANPLLKQKSINPLSTANPCILKTKSRFSSACHSLILTKGRN